MSQGLYGKLLARFGKYNKTSFERRKQFFNPPLARCSLGVNKVQIQQGCSFYAIIPSHPNQMKGACDGGTLSKLVYHVIKMLPLYIPLGWFQYKLFCQHSKLFDFYFIMICNLIHKNTTIYIKMVTEIVLQSKTLHLKKLSKKTYLSISCLLMLLICWKVLELWLNLYQSSICS